jgi:hypothetical protein
MMPRLFNRLLIAPEIIVVDLADAALIALEDALRLEHPIVDEPPPTAQPPVRRHARAVLRHAERLRASLRDYRRFVEELWRKAEEDDALF